MAQRLMLFLATALCAGIALGSLQAVPAAIPVMLVCISCAVAIVAWLRAPRLFLVSAIACAFVLGVVRAQVVHTPPDPVLAAHVGARVIIEGAVVSEPDTRERNIRLTVAVRSVEGESVHGRVIAIVPTHTEVAYGDTVVIHGVLRTPEAFETSNGRVFDYASFLKVRDISHEVAFATLEIRGSGGNPIVRGALALKRAYIDGLRMVLNEPYAGLAAGITAGDKRSVGDELTNVFQRVSLVHILVLSGYNISVVLMALSVALQGRSRLAQLLSAAAVVCFFYIISGGAASAVRAGVMAYISVYAHLSGRMYSGLYVLVIVGTAMILINPLVLLFDPGFQLSFLATAGLIAFTPHIAMRLQFVTERFGLREIVASSAATQAVVLPLLLYAGGVLSVVSLPANALVLIVVPFTMVCACIAAFAGMVFGTAGVVFALPAHVLLAYMMHVAQWFAAIPCAAISVPLFSGWWLMPVYVSFAYLAYKSKQPALLPAVRVGETVR